MPCSICTEYILMSHFARTCPACPFLQTKTPAAATTATTAPTTATMRAAVTTGRMAMVGLSAIDVLYLIALPPLRNPRERPGCSRGSEKVYLSRVGVCGDRVAERGLPLLAACGRQGNVRWRVPPLVLGARAWWFGHGERLRAHPRAITR